MNVLVAAYDCIPGAGSEPGLGWQFVSLAARDHDVWALTKESNRAAIEADRRADHINWEYIEVSEKLGPLTTGSPLGDVAHILRWFKPAMQRARDLHAQVGFDVTHYISFGAHWIPEPFSLLGPPHLFGPVTGGEDVPPGLQPQRNVVQMAADRARRTMQQGLMRRTAWRNMATSPATIMVAATTATKDRMVAAGAQDVRVFRPSFAVENDELEALEQLATPHESGPVSMVMSGRLIPWKGHELGLRAFAKALPALPEATMHLTGWGPEEANLLALIDELGITSSVTWHGRLDRDDERRLIATSDIFVLPSIRDAGATLLVYAMAAGRPIASLDTGAIAEMTEQASLRATVTSRAAATDGLADVMTQLGQNADLRSEMASFGQERVRSLFTRDAVHEAVEAWYSELVG